MKIFVRSHGSQGFLPGMALVLALAFSLACGVSATPTPTTGPTASPQPTPTTAPQMTAQPTAMPTPTAAPAQFTSEVGRLILALPPPLQEANIPWLTSGSGTLQQYPMSEPLVGVDVQSGEFTNSMLATRWEMAPDGRSWTFWLREGVPFHFGWGEFTAQDVEHSFRMFTQDESIAFYAGTLRTLIDRVEATNDHQVTIHLQRPEATMDFYASDRALLATISKAQWDAEGREGMERRPAGTGPYQYQDRSPGGYLRFERVEDHWRKTPEFGEMEMRWVHEGATRLATLLAHEVHLAAVPRELMDQAVARGMKTISGVAPGIETYIVFGGLYFSNPDKVDPQVPWTRPEVRQAMAMAVNTDEINETIFKGKGERVIVYAFHPTLAPQNPEWAQRFEEMYGYDPARAKQLLADAGYPNGFKVKIQALSDVSGYPEQPTVTEVLALYFQAIGLEVEIVTPDFGRAVRMTRDMAMHDQLMPLRGGTSYPPATLRGMSEVNNFYQHPALTEKLDQLDNTLNLEDRRRLLLELGDHMFYEFAKIPLLYLPVEVSVDPEVISDWVFPGNFSGNYTHTEYIVATR